MIESGRWRQALLSGLDAANEAALVPCLETLGFRCLHAPGDHSLERARFDVVFVDGRCAAPTVDAAALVWVVDAAANEVLDPLCSDWIDRPIRPLVVRAVIDRVLARCRLEQRIAELTRQLQAEAPPPTIIAESEAMRRLLGSATQASRAGRPLLLSGARGVGRGFVARHIAGHAQQGTHELRGDQLVQSDGAAQLQRAIEAVGRGTLIVRDVDEAPHEIQLALASRLRERLHAKVVVTAASAEQLRRELCQSLRELAVPSLRERTGDLEPLTRHFLSHYARGARLTPAALEALAAYDWPGEVAELRIAVEACTLRSRGEVDVCHLPERVLGSRAEKLFVGGPFTLAELEWAHVSAVLASGRSLQEVAHALGIDNSTLWRLRKRHARGRC